MVVEQKNCGSKPISRIEPPPGLHEDEISSTNHSQEVRFVDQGCQTDKSGVNNGHLGHQQSSEPSTQNKGTEKSF